jgi:transposase-like protein
VGIECRRCREEKQHRCQAQIFDDGIPLCLPCADDLPCVIDRVGAPSEPAGEPTLYEPESGFVPPPVIHRTPEELGIPAVVRVAGNHLHLWVEASPAVAEERNRKFAADLEEIAAASARRKSAADDAVENLAAQCDRDEDEDGKENAMISDELKQACLRDAETMKLREVAKKHGVGKSTIIKWRRDAGLEKKPSLGRPRASRSGATDAMIDTSAPRVNVSLELTPAEARARLEKLTPAQMAIALSAVLQASLREA